MCQGGEGCPDSTLAVLCDCPGLMGGACTTQGVILKVVASEVGDSLEHVRNP